MNGKIANDLNRLNFPIENINDYPSVLWVMGADEGDRESLTFRDHTHTFFELHIITEGSVVYGIDTREICVSAGKLLLFSPRCQHRVVGCADSFCKISIAFTLPETCPLYAELCARVPNVFKSNAYIEENIDFLLKCARTHSDYFAKIAKVRLAEIVYLSFEAMNAAVDEIPVKYDPRVYRAKKYIEDNPHIFFGCEEVAAFCRISAKQLGRLFRAAEGVSLLEYIHARKLDAAKELLADKTLSERRISEMLGFSGAEYFSRFFARLEGKLPTEYRKGL